MAVCDQTGTLATPLTVLRRHDTRVEDFAELQALVNRERAEGVLVGLPVQESGQSRRAGALGAALCRAPSGMPFPFRSRFGTKVFRATMRPLLSVLVPGSRSTLLLPR